jgi:hypothetical protein
MAVVRISIQAAHEQVNPTDLLHDVIYMDQNGTLACLGCSENVTYALS